MDLSNYSLEELFLTAIKSELESAKVYQALANKVENAFLKHRLVFLADEEDKHRVFVENVYKENFPGKEIVIPHESPVPLPEVLIKDEMAPISEVLENAMAAELTAKDFYGSLAGRFFEGSNHSKVLKYFARMEQLHYDILAEELENVRKFEEFDEVWPMMHLGP